MNAVVKWIPQNINGQYNQDGGLEEFHSTPSGTENKPLELVSSLGTSQIVLKWELEFSKGI